MAGLCARRRGRSRVSGFAAQGQTRDVTHNVRDGGTHSEWRAHRARRCRRTSRHRPLMLELRNPDFNTAVRIADAINAYSGGESIGMRAADEQRSALDLSRQAGAVGATRFMAEIGELLVEPDTPARVVIDARTGTVVIGQDVQISTVALTHGNLTVRVTRRRNVSQPAPFSRGRTVITPQPQSMCPSRVATSRSCTAPICARCCRAQPSRFAPHRHYRNPAGDQIRRCAAGRSHR